MESVGIPQLYLGLMLFHGPNGPEHLNDETAIQWFQRSREMDNYYAYFNLGYMYSHGYGAELDYEHAYECYMHAMMDSEARDPTNEVLLLKDDKVSSEIEAAFAELSKNGLTALLKEISNI
jgi:TPR repeat protein